MLENLPESFLLQLADIDPVVWMVSKKLYKVCGCKRIDAWKFVTSARRFKMAISIIQRDINIKAFGGIQSISYANYASCDKEFMDMIRVLSI
jgi:hypothetical protein